MATTIAVAGIVLLLLGFPMWLIFLLVSIVGLHYFTTVSMEIVVQVLYGSLNQFLLLAIPGFIFAGEVMAQGGISRRLVAWIATLLARVPGGVPLTTIGACELFGAISGSSSAAVAALGRVLYPGLIQSRYPEKFALGLITSSGAIAVIIPPSLSMILYSALTNASIGRLFLAGFIPGILVGVCVGVYCVSYSLRHRLHKGSDWSWKEVLRVSRDAVWALGAPVLVFGGIYSGLFTPTEAAMVFCVYAIAVVMFIYRELNLAGLMRVARSSVALTAKIFIIVAASSIFSWVLTAEQVPQNLIKGIADLQMSPVMVLLVINIVLLIAGMFIDPNSSIIILVPLLWPVARHVGVDIIHFGIIITVNLAIGMFTPPFGLNIFVSSSVFRVPTARVVSGLGPFIIAYLVALALVTYIPEISLALPNAFSQ